MKSIEAAAVTKTEPKTGTVVLVSYGGKPPTDDEIRREVGITAEEAGHGQAIAATYTYVVPTAALERQRKGMAPAHQFALVNGEFQAQLVFNKVLRHFLGTPLLSRAEQRVALLRAIGTVARTPGEAHQLRREGWILWMACRKSWARG